MTVLAVAGLSGLTISCSGTATVPQQRADGASATPSAAGEVVNTAARPARGSASAAVRLDDEFEAPQLQQRFEAVARKVSRSVVAISAVDVSVIDDALLHPDTANPARLDAALATQDRTVGTGFVIDAGGFIVTNEHVVAKAGQVWVTTDDRRVYPAVIVGTDPRSDLAVLKIPATDLPTLRIAPAAARRGQWTLAIGNPYGLAGDGELAVSVGVVSAVARSLPKLAGKEDRLYQDLVQTTAQINPGNSGGPLFDLDGNVVGINCAVILPFKQTNGIGFAMPINARVRGVLDRLMAGRSVDYAYLGVRTSTPSAAECRAAGIAGDAGGAKVDYVEPGSPAEAGGLRVGDVVCGVDGQGVRDSEQFVIVVGDRPLGRPVTASVRRSGRPVDVAVTLRPRESSVTAAAVTAKTQTFNWRGVQLGAAADGAGVVAVSVDPKSPLAADVKVGDAVESLGGVKLKTVADVTDALARGPAERCAMKVSGGRGGAVAAARE